jgi:hypothetical protein
LSQSLGQPVQIRIERADFERLAQEGVGQAEGRPAWSSIQEALHGPDGWGGFEDASVAKEGEYVHHIVLSETLTLGEWCHGMTIISH